ncbi:CAP domain-containing protein [Xinfangfangia sp. D13-10-4-6]|uniref:CAP domain-containing protein n=1 Tax=Pseudogemmobacter hezensis TaxID=2737662 RepID=UPI00155825E8|nr:CAP domain-containing protein [Pseudogemmobacter hezensis]NPD16597.1 CAP domain-containing protein [Pseudogemmobacter hezensis]
MRVLLPAMAAAVIALATPALACTSPSERQQIRQEFTHWVNDLRAERGLSPLRLNQTLDQAAVGHVCDMATRSFMSHSGSNGSNLKMRLKRAGYGLRMANENLARSSSPPSSSTAARLWLNSPTHLVNLLDPNITEMGLAVAVNDRHTYYVFVGGRPKG